MPTPPSLRANALLPCLSERLKFKTDENVPAEAAELLRSAGFDALTVLEQVLGGANDSTVSDAETRIESS